MKFKFPSLKKDKKEPKKKIPSYVTMRPRVDNTNILAQAKKRQKQTVYLDRKAAVPESVKSIPFRKIILSVLSIALIVGLFLFLKNTSIFDVKETVVITDKVEDYNTIKTIVDSYKGKNILFVSGGEITQKIKEKFTSIHTVFIDKSLSGTLRVEVIEDVPIFYEANNTGIYLINQSGFVMEIVEPDTKLAFDDTEKLLRDNKLPVDSDQVRIKYLSRFEESERAKIIWKDVPREEKESALNQLKDELNNKINDFANKLSDQLKGPKFKDLIGSYIPNSQIFKVGDSVPLDNLNFVSVVLDYFKSKNLITTRVIWESEYTLEVLLQDNPSVLLTVKRSYTEQFDDLNTLIYYGQFNGAKTVDVRSSNYSVVR